MLLTMLENRRGTEDGYHIRLYLRGETYEMGDTLAHRFLSAGYAIPQLPHDKLLPQKCAEADIISHKKRKNLTPKK